MSQETRHPPVHENDHEDEKDRFHLQYTRFFKIEISIIKVVTKRTCDTTHLTTRHALDETTETRRLRSLPGSRARPKVGGTSGVQQCHESIPALEKRDTPGDTRRHAL